MIKIAKYFLRLFLKFCFSVEVTGLENYDKAGKRVLIVANHTSLLDGVLLYAWLPETPTFAINTEISEQTSFKPFLRFVDLFKMDPMNPLSIKSMVKFIKQDRKAVIFPEGRITITGTLMKIYEGPGLIADKSDAMILPVAIDGAQLSKFSYMKGKAKTRWFPRINMHILPPEKIVIPKQITGNERRKQAVLQMQDIMFRVSYHCTQQSITLFQSLILSSEKYGSDNVVLEDTTREQVDYKNLVLRALVLARLIKSSTKADEHVGILLPNVNAMPVVFFALQFLGRVPAMLNFTAGILTVQRCCKTANINTILTSRRFIEQANLQALADELEKEHELIYLDDLKETVKLRDKLIALYKSKSPVRHYLKQQINTNPDSAAVILFTSGSEGQPKGVVLSHRNLLSNYAQVRCHIHFSTSDVIFCCLPLFHSFGLNAGFLMPIFGGSKIFMYPTPLHYRIIPELIYELRANIFYATNTFYKGYARFAHPYDFDSLEVVVAGAEKLHDDTAQVWMQRFGKRIYQGYGVTETSPVISVNNKMQSKYGSVGRLVPEMECYLEPVEGIEKGGKLVVKGPNVMLGYLLHDKPGVLQPPSTAKGAGWYDTGDIADIDDDGFITILGRAKRFAKVGGEMVSLSGVEELASLTWPNIPHAAVAVHDERKGEKIILVTEKKDAERKPLQEVAREKKIGEMTIPREIQTVDAIPVLGTGKTDYITLQKQVNDLLDNQVEDKQGIIGKLKQIVEPKE
ncbi:MAG: AMP-binding protein [Pseudomonadota bacterium]